MKRIRTMGQILPGLWIGRMGAIRSIFELQAVANDNNNQQELEEWTIISILSSESIIAAVKDNLKQEQLRFGSSDRPLVKRHEVWDLADKAHAPFVSDRLEEICQIISDSFDLDLTVDKATMATDRPRRNCLVHCAKGVSRSAAVCSAWLMSRHHYSLPQSLDLIVQARNNACPNLGFLAGLKAIEKCQGDIGKAQARLQSRQSKKGSNNNNSNRPTNSNTASPAKQPEPVKSKEAKSPPRSTQHQFMDEKRKQLPMQRRSDNVQKPQNKEPKKNGSIVVQKRPTIMDEKEVLQAKKTGDYNDEISV